MTSPKPIRNPPTVQPPSCWAEVGQFESGQQGSHPAHGAANISFVSIQGRHAKQLLAAWLSGPVHSSLRLSRWNWSAVIGTVVQEAETSSEGSHKRKPHFLLICFYGIWALRARAMSLDAEMVAHRVHSRTGGWNTRSTNLEVVAVRLKYLLLFA